MGEMLSSFYATNLCGHDEIAGSELAQTRIVNSFTQTHTQLETLCVI